MKIKNGGLAKRVWQEHVKKYKFKIFRAMLCMATAAAATMAFPYFLKPAFDFIFQSTDITNLFFLGACILVTFLIKGASSYGESFIMTCVGQKIIFDIQERLFKHLVNSDLEFFNHHNSGDLISRFANDVTLMRNTVSTVLASIGKDFLTFIFLAGLMFYRDAVLALISFTLVPLAIVPIVFLGRKMKRITQATQKELGVFSGSLSQVFLGIRIVKAYEAEDFEVKRVTSKIADLMKLIIKTIKIKALLHPISESIAGLAIIGVLIYGGIQIIEGQKTVGDLVSFLGALLISYEPIRRLMQLSANVQEGLGAAQRVFEILDTNTRIQNSYTSKFLDTEIESIEFKDVEFLYSNNCEKNIINKISFKVQKGQTIAFVGQSGAGKSTIINLIPRFYDITAGEILINGINIKDIDLHSLRSKIGIVTQDNILFDTSFYKNIAYGKKENASYEEVIKAAKDSLSQEFIELSEEGYNTIVGENGARISGGQKQRISIARAMLKNAPILLLDEATSALDVHSERTVQKALEKLMKNRTTIIVAHRLSSIISADVIYVMEDGNIIESGTHEKLLSLNGVYSNLWMSQTNEHN